MLLFIFTKLYRICRRYSFKYISCYCLSISRVRIRSTSLYSNTSHVIVYQWPSFFFFGFVWIQIHLMLLFIHNGEMVPYCISNSNTSHVIVYLATGGKGVRTFSIQIHLMLLFIQWFSCNHLSGFHIQIHLMLLFITRAARKKLVWDLFKYISCYCLSLTSLILSIIPLNSNTSHVIVYHTGVFCKNLRLRIQIHLMLLFIILSGATWRGMSDIQIHLMLLFICGLFSKWVKTQIFKYISCYCLSPHIYSLS